MVQIRLRKCGLVFLVALGVAGMLGPCLLGSPAPSITPVSSVEPNAGQAADADNWRSAAPAHMSNHVKASPAAQVAEQIGGQAGLAASEAKEAVSSDPPEVDPAAAAAPGGEPIVDQAALAASDATAAVSSHLPEVGPAAASEAGAEHTPGAAPAHSPDVGQALGHPPDVGQTARAAPDVKTQGRDELDSPTDVGGVFATNVGQEALPLSHADHVGDPALIRPLIWLHFPRCGSSFATTLVHHACGSWIPDGFTLGVPSETPSMITRGLPCKHNGGSVNISGTLGATCRWNNFCGGRPFARFSNFHEPLWLLPRNLAGDPRVLRGSIRRSGGPFGDLERVDDSYLPKVVAMFRLPSQRVISAWLSNSPSIKIPGETFGAFAKRQGACMTQQVLGIACGFKKDGAPFLLGLGSTPAVRLATSRVKKFGFVGLKEHWSLSVCLFHKMYGGDCMPAEFKDVRRGPKHKQKYETKQWFLDEYKPLDDMIYGVAKNVFWKRVAEHGVHAKVCKEQICPRTAGKF